MEDNRLLIYEGIRERTYKLLAECYLVPDAEIFEKLFGLHDALDSICPDAAEFIDTASDTSESVDMEPLNVSGATVVVGAFADYVEKNIEPDNTGRKNLRLMQLICAAIRSSMIGQPVDIPEASDEPIEY